MECLKPVLLKSGIAVPCGQCDICKSNRRNEWSIRLAIHLNNCDRMPMFITLTYDNDHLPFICMDWKTCKHEHFTKLDFDECPEMEQYWNRLTPTLVRSDISKFIKAYKRKYKLDNDVFQYFGCGEYGDSIGKHRPHYHLLFFGDNGLYNDFFNDVAIAEDRIKSVWKHGFVHVGVAGYDGIHYVTKYCLKDGLDELHPLAVRPFTIASNGIGNNLINSDYGKKLKSKLDYVTKHKDEIFSKCPDFDFYDRSSLVRAIDYFEGVLPSFRIILDDGRRVFIPRAIRKKLIGSFEYFKDSPFWILNYLRMLLDSYDYYRDFGDYDQSHETNRSFQSLLSRVEKIRKRLNERKYNNNLKREKL